MVPLFIHWICESGTRPRDCNLGLEMKAFAHCTISRARGWGLSLGDTNNEEMRGG